MLDFYQQAGLGPDQIPNTRPPYSPTRAQDEYLESLGLARAPTDRPLADTAWVAPTAVDGVTQQAVMQPRTPSELAEGRSLRLRPSGMGEPGQDSAGGMLARAPGFAKSIMQSFNPFEDDISLRERGWRTLNVASLALPLGVGSQAIVRGSTAIGLSARLAKIFPALNGATQTRRGKIMLTSIAEAGVSGSIEAVKEDGNVVMGALVGGVVGGGAAGVALRLGARGVRKATAQMADDFQNPDKYVSGGDNPFTSASDWAVLTPQQLEDVQVMRMETTPDNIRQASARRGREQMEVMEAMLRERGFHPVYSQLDDGRDAWLVPGLPARDAANIARDLGVQKQVLTKPGLLDLETDMIRPIDLSRTRVGLELEPGVDQYLTVGVRGADGQGSLYVSHAVDTAREPVRFGWGKDLLKFTRSVPSHREVGDLFDETAVSSGVWDRFANLDTRHVLGRVYRDTINALHGASVLDDMVSVVPTRGRGGAAGASQLASGETRRVRDSMARLFQLNNGKWSGATEVAFRSGIRDWADPLQEFRPGSRGLFQTLEEHVPASEMQVFQEYAALRRWQLLHEAGKAQPIDPAKFPGQDALVSRYESALKEVTQWQNDWIENTLVRTGVISREQFTALKDAPENQIFIPLLRTKKGAMPRNLEEFDFWKMDLDDSGSLHEAADPLRGLASTVDADQDMWTPWLEELMLRAGQYARMASQQEAYNQVGMLARANPAVFGQLLTRLPGKPVAARGAKVMGANASQPLFRKDGVTYLRTVDPDESLENLPWEAREDWYEVKSSALGQGLVDALEFLGPSKVGAVGGALGAFAAVSRAGTTVSQDFVGKNISRDIIFAFASAGVHPTAFLAGSLHMAASSRLGRVLAPAQAARSQKLIDDFLASGAARAALVSQDRKYFRDMVHEAVGSGGVVRNVASGLNPLKALQMFSEAMENTTRVGSFRQQMKRLNTEVARGNRAGLTSGDIADASAIYSRNASVDFALHGASALQQNVNASTAFFNATLQGSREMVEAAAADPMGTGFRMLAGITLPSTLLYLHNRKDPDYANLPAHERDLFWHIKRPAGLLGDDASDPSDDLWLRVAKPFEPGMLAGTFVEHFLEWVDREDPEFLDQATQEMGARMAGGYVPVPTVAQPWLEQLANRSSLTEQPIVPRSLQGVDASLHEGSEFANALAGWLNQDAEDPERKISPLTLDNYVRSWTGQMGVMGSDIVDFTVDRYRDATGEPVPRAERSLLQKLPLVRSFASSFPSGARSIADAYSLADDARVATRTLAYLEEGARMDDYQDYYMREGVAENVAMAPVFERMTARVAELRQTRGLVVQSPDMSPQEKRRALHEIDRGIIEYTHELVKASREIGLRPNHASPPLRSVARRALGQAPQN